MMTMKTLIELFLAKHRVLQAQKIAFKAAYSRKIDVLRAGRPWSQADEAAYNALRSAYLDTLKAANCQYERLSGNEMESLMKSWIKQASYYELDTIRQIASYLNKRPRLAQAS